MNSHICSVCGYVYSHEAGDPDRGILPGIPFDRLPEGWVCPVCGATKEMFMPE